MGVVIGMDEAGYGPNLGPLVITATVWDVPGVPGEVDLWDAFAELGGPEASRDSARLQIADSKQVYSRVKGIAPLERSVTSALLAAGLGAAGFRAVWNQVCPNGDDHSPPAWQSEPWFAEADLALPSCDHPTPPADIARRWAEWSERTGIRLRAVQSDVVLTRRFNRLTRDFGSKGVALSRTSLQLLRRVWDPADSQPVSITADKHGGRNRYDDLLSEICGDCFVFRGIEGRMRSSYRVGSAEVTFQTKAETHLPVALASMVSKYLREIAMLLFNRFWARHVPGLRPTQGYPVDARRFRHDIAAAQARLGIVDDDLWRER